MSTLNNIPNTALTSNTNTFLYNYTTDIHDTDFIITDTHDVFSSFYSNKDPNSDGNESSKQKDKEMSVIFYGNNDTAIKNSTYEEFATASTDFPTKALLQEIFNITMTLSTTNSNSNNRLKLSNETTIISKKIENVTSSYYNDYYDPTNNTHFWELDGIIQLILSIKENSTSIISNSNNSIIVSFIQKVQYLSYDVSAVSFYDIISKPILEEELHGNITYNSYIYSLEQNNVSSSFVQLQGIKSFQINGTEQVLKPTLPSSFAQDDDPTMNNGLLNILNSYNINKQYFLIGLITFDAILLLSVMIAFLIKRKSFFSTSDNRNIVVVDATHDNHLSMDLDCNNQVKDKIPLNANSWQESNLTINSNNTTNTIRQHNIHQIIVPPGKLNVIIGTTTTNPITKKQSPPTVVCVRGYTVGDRLLHVGDQLLMIDDIDVSSFMPNDVAGIMIEKQNFNRRITIARGCYTQF